MTNNRQANRNLRNTRRQSETDALNRLAAILEHLTNPPLAASITNNYISVNTLTTLNQGETSTEPRTEEPKRKKTKANQNYTIPSPTPSANPNYTYITQPPPPRKEYTGPHPLCHKCKFHHPTHTACRLCASCDRLGHFATHCRTNPIPIYSVAPTPYNPNIKPAKSCYECGDPNHFKKACPKLRVTPAPQPDHKRNFALITTQAQDCPLNQKSAPTVSTPQNNQAPDF